MSKIVRSIKNVANGYLSTQILVRKATSNDPSGPTTYDMEEIAAATFNSQTEFLEIMDMLDRRLNDKGKNWRHVAKSLTVLDYLARFGADKCVLWLKDNLYIIKTLREFVHFDETNNDQGAIIRVKAKELVLLLRDDERLTRERQMARANNGRNSARREQNQERERERRAEPYDADLQRALELSRETAEEERARARPNDDDPDLQAALKLSLEEDEMRRLRNAENSNLLDLDAQPYYQQVQYQQPQQTFQPQTFQPQQTYQQVQYFQEPQQTYQALQQYDMFGNPIQASTTGLFPQYAQQPQVPQFTGFASPAEELKPLKTGNNNPFALLYQEPQTQQQPQQPSLNDLAQAQPQTQPVFYTQPPQPQQPPQLSRLNDSHELNALLATGTGIDTFGNTGAARVPHQHTKTGTFVNSSGTGYRTNTADVRLSSNATGNPFLNTGIGSTANAGNMAGRIDPAPTGFGFGNSKDEPSLIDI